MTWKKIRTVAQYAPAIIALARSLGLKVVGEGVESKWQLEFLKRQGCDLVQGFLISKPLSADDYVGHLKREIATIQVYRSRCSVVVPYVDISAISRLPVTKTTKPSSPELQYFLTSPKGRSESAG